MNTAYFVVGRTSTQVVPLVTQSWMVVRTNEAQARGAAVDAARSGRLAAWTDRGEMPAMDVVRSCFSAEGVMLRGSGPLVMIPVTLGSQWDEVERDGRLPVRDSFLTGVVRSALSCTASEKRFLRGMERRLGPAHGVWDAARGVGVVLRATELTFSQPFAVTKDSSRDRGVDATVLAVRHTLLTNGVREDLTTGS